VLLLSDTRRKPITAITAVLLQFVSYLLTLRRNNDKRKISLDSDIWECVMDWEFQVVMRTKFGMRRAL
jgi:hypothetical protein